MPPTTIVVIVVTVSFTAVDAVSVVSAITSPRGVGNYDEQDQRRIWHSLRAGH
jgi:hypothetical protein